MHDPVPPCLIPIFAGLFTHSPAFLKVGINLVPDGQLLSQFIGFSERFLPFPGFLLFFMLFEMGAGIQNGSQTQATEDHEASAKGITGCRSYHK
jgi:hypothetical protein